jgi:hypothetical protein
MVIGQLSWYPEAAEVGHQGFRHRRHLLIEDDVVCSYSLWRYNMSQISYFLLEAVPFRVELQMALSK